MSNERFVSLSEMKSILEEESSRRDLTHDQKSALEHAETFVKLSPEDTQQLIDELLALEFATEFACFKIADILPRHPEDVRAIFSKERVSLEKTHINQIIDIVGKYL